ncbi:hypothetical protein VTK73DRAFT_2545 [Phialemonium thermophilum]|uniref:Uncharacterized protein n=1 Tax=Phialemonium thermophilum TaxID=223376 RepID=A0ABR3VS07_9PEZI
MPSAFGGTAINPPPVSIDFSPHGLPDCHRLAANLVLAAPVHPPCFLAEASYGHFLPRQRGEGRRPSLQD